MPLYFYSKPIVPETCFEITEDPGIELGKAEFRVRPEAVGIIAVEARTLKEAKRMGAGLVDAEMAKRLPK